MRVRTLLSLALGATAAVLSVTAVTGAQAAVGDTLVYQFNAQATGGAVPGPISQAMLTLVETATGVDFTLSPHWAQTTGNAVNSLVFAYSGEALSYSDGAGPDAAFSTGSGGLNASYTSASLITLNWPANPKFDNSAASASWALTGPTLTLADFTVLATTPSTQPSPAFGIIAMPAANPQNWVATEGSFTAAVPEPQTTAMMVMGLLGVGAAVRRRLG